MVASSVEVVDLQLLIMFYKGEVRENPSCVASVALLESSRENLMKIKKENGL